MSTSCFVSCPRTASVHGESNKFGHDWNDECCAEFQGPPDEVKCEEYQNYLIDEGRDDLVEMVDCAALWFDKQHVGFWLISIYFVVVTLTTCALLLGGSRLFIYVSVALQRLAPRIRDRSENMRQHTTAARSMYRYL